MSTLPGSRLGVALLGVALLGLSSGCYTRLTNPKEAFNYRHPNGSLIGSSSAKAIPAPAYNRYLKERAKEDEVYRLQPGTRINVEVYGQEITKTVNIRPDGGVDLPLIGDIQAEGKTIAEFKSEISGRYAEFFVTPPQVIVNTEVTELGNRVQAGEVSVLNPTGNQGVVSLTGDEMLSEVLAEVGALHPKSEWNEVAVIRQGRVIKERYLIISDFERLVRYGDIDQDIRVRNGDIVFIPFEKNTLLEEFFATFGVLGDLFEDLDTITRYIDLVEGF